jgi:hypothetical protein
MTWILPLVLLAAIVGLSVALVRRDRRGGRSQLMNGRANAT